MQVNLTLHQYYETLNILEGVFSPLDGFMSSADLKEVISPSMSLASGDIFPVPVLLDISEETVNLIKGKESVDLFYKDSKICRMEIGEVFSPDKELIAQQVYGTTDLGHPGVLYLKNSNDYSLSGKLIAESSIPQMPNYMNPADTRAFFKEKGWNTVAGFQTRNVPHKAHEYLHRLALEIVDGLMIQPLVGWKKAGDYTQEAIEASYKVMIRDFYPKDRVLFNLLYTPMRYAGPKEALLHAIIRRNFGCTHFIVGRDHAGVKDFYGVYDAQKLALKHEDRLGIKILAIKEPYYCKRCDAIVTEKHCGHAEDSKYRSNISGTMIRAMLEHEEEIDCRYFRPEILDSLKNIDPFI